MMKNTSPHSHILILGWPTSRQSWLTDYPFVHIDRIYAESLPPLAKRCKTLSFHTPKFLHRITLLSPQHWYGDWKTSIKNYDTVILIDEVRGRDVFEFILKENRHCRLFVFYDSPIEHGSRKDPSHYRDLPIHFCTCDRKIATEYHLPFIPYFYIFSPYRFNQYAHLPPVKSKRDVFFVGEEKGSRKKELSQIAAALENAGLTYEFRLVRQRRHGHHWQDASTDYLPYSQVIHRIESSRAILELISNGQTGLTQRPYEALFFRKKLITNSDEVRHYDFYRPENIFILGKRNMEDLPQFLRAPYQPLPEAIINQYDFLHWLARFYQ